ncbi:TPA: hypothetical protein U2R10_002936 [Proteus mirabilis]|uniref:Uncharacterized protein n=8 Tax=Gammaproteobacteria TaxID=1236 RepID=A0A2X2C2S0_PROMI|nr:MULTISPECIES: hypothetical protein [Proteus]MBA7798700.1 hypothetical protein [Citrobacter sp. RHBSTW-01065]NBM63187.1 hypothetical protein [Proteus sp. G4445]SSJ74080.1 Uncharacterised protein [Klebsiella pneumoniae]ALE21540.1 hypothetical protein AOC00_04325 [Proteus mirabilis]ALE24666.1 hypothetical protein AOB99_04325 [Proteus mirabilis]
MSDTIMQSTWQTKELGMVTRKGKSVTPESSFFQTPHIIQTREDGSTVSTVCSRSGKEVTFVTPKGKRIRASQNEVFNTLLKSIKSVNHS